MLFSFMDFYFCVPEQNNMLRVWNNIEKTGFSFLFSFLMLRPRKYKSIKIEGKSESKFFWSRIQNKNKKHMLQEEEKGRKDVVMYDGMCVDI